MSRTLVVLALLVAQSWPARARRRALVIGVNTGLPSEAVLRFAEADARRVARALAEVGFARTQDVVQVVGGGRRGLERALRAAAQRGSAGDTLLIFISGHASGRGLHVAGEVLPWARLRALINRVPARVLVGFVDACQSGALLAPKGFVRGPPLKLSSARLGLRGRVLISSSGSNEISHESERLRGSPFAHYLVSGLRGLADRDGDRGVTLAELYRYLYARTVAATLDAPSGPQHPTGSWRLHGTGDVVLSELRRGWPRLRQGDRQLGRCYVLDEAERRVIAEVHRGGGPPLSLRPGVYRIKCVAGDAARVATVRLRTGATSLAGLRFARQRVTASLAKGNVGRRLHLVELGAGARYRRGRPWLVTGALRYRSVGKVSWGAQATGGGDGTTGRAALLGEVGFAVPWWRLLGGGLELGLEAGAGLSFASEVSEIDALFGQYARLGWRLSPRWRLVSRVDLLTVLPLRQRSDVGLSVLMSVGIGLCVFGCGG